MRLKVLKIVQVRRPALHSLTTHYYEDIPHPRHTPQLLVGRRRGIELCPGSWAPPHGGRAHDAESLGARYDGTGGHRPA